MSVALVIALVLVVAAFIIERRLMLGDFATERREWTQERAALINRDPVVPIPALVGESFNAVPIDGPNADESYWEDQEN